MFESFMKIPLKVCTMPRTTFTPSYDYRKFWLLYQQQSGADLTQTQCSYSPTSGKQHNELQRLAWWLPPYLAQVSWKQIWHVIWQIYWNVLQEEESVGLFHSKFLPEKFLSQKQKGNCFAKKKKSFKQNARAYLSVDSGPWALIQYWKNFTFSPTLLLLHQGKCEVNDNWCYFVPDVILKISMTLINSRWQSEIKNWCQSKNKTGIKLFLSLC